MDVTDDAAPTTPDMILRTTVLLQWYSVSSMLLIEPVIIAKNSCQRLEFNCTIFFSLHGTTLVMILQQKI